MPRWEGTCFCAQASVSRAVHWVISQDGEEVFAALAEQAMQGAAQAQPGWFLGIH